MHLNTVTNLVIVGSSSAMILMIGIIVYTLESKSRPAKAFLFFCIITFLWGISNSTLHESHSVYLTLWLLRTHLFIAIWHAYIFQYLSGTFKDIRSHNEIYIFITAVVVSTITLTPFTFSKIIDLADPGEVTIPDQSWGMIIFCITTIIFIIIGTYRLISQIHSTRGEQKTQAKLLSYGMFLTLAIIITFNVILPVLFNNASYIPLSSLSVLPFIALVSLAIFKHRLFNAKVTIIHVAISLLWTFILFKILISNKVVTDDLLLLTISLIFGIILVRDLVHISKQQQTIEKLSSELKTAYKINNLKKDGSN